MIGLGWKDLVVGSTHRRNVARFARFETAVVELKIDYIFVQRVYGDKRCEGRICRLWIFLEP